MKLLLICGSHPRNLELASKALQSKFVTDAHLIIIEREELVPPPPPNIAKDLMMLWDLHFRRRQQAEERFVNTPETMRSLTKITTLRPEELNTILTSKLIHKTNADLCLISGAPIISGNTFGALPKISINLHLGLIPEYKGSITMFWPFYFMEPTMAGCTYHIIETAVDTGLILHQSVPKLSINDTMHDVAAKALLEALKYLDEIFVWALEKQNPNPTFQSKELLFSQGKLFKKSDFSPDKLRVNYQLFDDKMTQHAIQGKLVCRQPKLISQLE